MALKRWLLAGLLAAVLFAAVVRAQDDDEDEADDSVGIGRAIPMPEGGLDSGIDAEDAANEIAENAVEEEDVSAGQFGVRAGHYFPAYADLKVPAGERLEVLVPVSSALQNPTYEIMMVTGHISLLDHSRFIQNFSAQLYQRTVEAGETATVKYSVTPDALLDPMEYAFVVAVYVRNIEDNTTFAVAAVNGTMFVQDPLGVDFKGYFSVIIFFGAIGGGIYYAVSRKPARAAPRRKEAVETGTKDTAYDPEFVDKTHIQYATQQRTSSPTKRNRSASK